MQILGTLKYARWILAGIALMAAAWAQAAKAQESAPLGSNLLTGYQTIGDSQEFAVRPVLLPALIEAAPMRGSLGEANPQYGPNIGRFDQRWEVEAGVVFTRFRSSVFYASMVGFRSSIGYHLNDWLTAEGGITTGFAPQIFDREHVKYLDYMGGLRIGPRRDKFSPWVHAEIGGAHILPQTAGNSKNAFAVKAGMGMEYAPWNVVSFRGQLDWLHTQFFSQSQENFQASLGVIFHF